MTALSLAGGRSVTEREPLIRPFGFKGGYMTEIWQTAVQLESATGGSAIGLGTQSVLWSDAHIFAAQGETGGNALMHALTEHALKLITGQRFTDPVALLEAVWPDVLTHGRFLTGNSSLRETFALNALVAVDNAAWLLFASERGVSSFDEMIPPTWRGPLAHRHPQVASIPLVGYLTPPEEMKALVADGYYFMKMKLGQPGTQAEMLAKDKARLTEIHRAIGHLRTPHTRGGKLPYYFDANQRYESKDTLLRLLDHARAIGAFDQIAVLEEPFIEELEVDIRDLPVRVAADESAHTDADARRRIEMGYSAIALKPIAKTLSMTLKIAHVAHERGVPCFCADLTVHPILVEWNKNVAARLAPFPGGDVGLIETNGHQNYRNWEAMRAQHPLLPTAEWAQPRGGMFALKADYYAQSGGIFTPSPHWEAKFA